jgi:DnaJ-class molecular chaperone
MIESWSILNLKRGASLEEIIRAYRKLSMKLHPDRGGDEKAFKEMKAAYEWLVDNFDIPEPVIVRSSLDDKPVKKPKSSGFSGYNRWEEREAVEIDENFIHRHSNFYGFNNDGSANFRFELGQLLRGDKVKIKIPNYEETEYEIPKRTRPGSILFVEMVGTASWLPGKRTVSVKVQLIPHPVYTVQGLNIVSVIQMTVLEAIERKAINIQHPFNVSELTGSSLSLQLPIADTIGSIPIVYKNYGFDDGKDIGDLYIYVIIELPKNLSPEKLEIIRKVLK